MKIAGIDFTSAPTRSKPIAAATGVLAKRQLSIESVRGLASFNAFEREIAEPGPWVAGTDFPFGQPSSFVQTLVGRNSGVPASSTWRVWERAASSAPSERILKDGRPATSNIGGVRTSALGR